LANSFDTRLGGQDFDNLLLDHFCKEFATKYKIQPETNARARIRLLTEVEKLKKQMSANSTKLPLNIECLMDDKDVSSSLCRADFEIMAADLFDRAERTFLKCFIDSSMCESPNSHNYRQMTGMND
jgi:heat shock protein